MTCKTKQFLLALATLAAAANLCGCRQQSTDNTTPPWTNTAERASRRAYHGAPPVIPHPPQGAACVTCHTETGKPVPNLGMAPANPHGVIGDLQNCRQCHLFQNKEQPFVENQFVGLSTELRVGERLFFGAPPVIPHSLLMRHNCAACHDGPAARPELRCTHPERQNCRQCHLES